MPARRQSCRLIRAKLGLFCGRLHSPVSPSVPTRSVIIETMSAATDAFVQQNQARLLDELKQLLRIPSISTLPENRGDVARAATFVADALRAAGMEHVEIIPTANHPLVYADWLHAPGKPTVLCYGHYDVQPA